MAISPDKAMLAVASPTQSEIRLYKTTSGQLVECLWANAHVVYALAFGPDSKTLYSGGEDGTLREWDLTTAKETRHWKQEPGWYPTALAASADGSTLAVMAGTAHLVPGVMRSELRVLDAVTFKERLHIALPAAWSWEVTLSRDGSHVAAALAHGRAGQSRVKLWDTKTGKETILDPSNSHEVFSVVFSPIGNTLASAGEDGVVRLWNSADGMELPLTKGPAGSTGACCAAGAPSGKVLASATADGTVQLWDCVRGVPSHTLRTHQAVVSRLLFSADGTFVLAATTCHGSAVHECARHICGKQARVGGSAPSGLPAMRLPCRVTTKPWPRLTASLPSTCGKSPASQAAMLLQGHDSRVLGVAWSPDGRLVATMTAKNIRLWNAQTANRLAAFPLQGFAGQHGNVQLTFASDGLTLLVSYDNGATVEVFDSAAGQPILQCDIGKCVQATHWLAPDSSALFVHAMPGRFRTFDLGAGHYHGPDVECGGDAVIAELSSNCTTLALGFADGRLQLWRVSPPRSDHGDTVKLDQSRLQSLWAALNGPEARKAYLARWQALPVASPNRGVPARHFAAFASLVRRARALHFAPGQPVLQGAGAGND